MLPSIFHRSTGLIGPERPRGIGKTSLSIRKLTVGRAVFSGAITFLAVNASSALGFTSSSKVDPHTGSSTLFLRGPSPSEAEMIRQVYSGRGPTLTVKQTKDGFEVTGNQSEQLAAIVTLLSRTNEDFQNKVIVLENQTKALNASYHQQENNSRHLYDLVQVGGIAFGVCLVALVGIAKNQVTKVRIKLKALETSIESRRK